MIKPLADRVLVKMKKREETTQSGIILTSLDKEETKIGEIISLGPGGNVEGKNIEMYVKIGEHVVINKYVGNEIKYEDEDYLIIKQSDILAIVD